MANYKISMRIPLTSWIIFSAICIFLCLSFLGIHQIGLTTDECVFVNAAISGGRDDYIYIKFFNFPFMTFFYEGALKAWLYYPIFKLFGVSVLSIRIPAIMLAAVAIFVWYKSSQYLFKNNAYSLLFLLFMATDPAFIHHTNIEFNTVALHSLLIAITFYFYLRFIATQSPHVLAWLFAFLILGIFNRFNFIWVAFGLLVTGLLFDYRAVWSAYKKNAKATLLYALLFFVTMVLMTIFFLIPASAYPVGGSILSTLSRYRVYYMANLYWYTMAGDLPYMTLFGKTIPYLGLKNVIEIGITLLALCGGILASIRHVNNQEFSILKKYQLFFLVLCLIIFAVMVITPPARMSYHMLTLWPLPQLLFLLSVAMLACFMNRKVRLCFFLFCGASILALQLLANYQFLQTLNDESTQINPNWTLAIYKLTDYVNENAKNYDEIATMSFGTTMQLIALANDDAIRNKLHEEVWALLLREPHWKTIRNLFNPGFNQDDATNRKWLYDNIFKHKKVLLIDSVLINRDTEAVDFPAFASDYHLSTSYLGRINDKHDQPIYYLYLVQDTADH